MRSVRPDAPFLPSLAQGLLVALLLCFTAQPLHANAATKPSDPSTNPALASLIKSGAQLFYMGRSGGLDGWLAVKNGQVQTIYKPINSAYILTGDLFGPKGDNLTAAQIKNLSASNKAVAALMAAGTTTDSPVAAPTGTAAPKPDASDAALPAGERFMKELDQAFSVTLGSNAEAPHLDVIIMPQCDGCQSFWQEFREPLQKGLLRLRFFPVAPENTDLEKAAAQLLHAPDPLGAWDKYSGGDATALAGTPDPALIAHVRANTALGERWRLPVVPYILYRGKDGQVKVVQGAPKNAQLVLDDLGPEKTEPAKP